MRATGQTKYLKDGEYSGAETAEMGEDGVVCKEQGKDACKGQAGSTNT